jgi:uncharacterized protein YecT (DUF1311 family)
MAAPAFSDPAYDACMAASDGTNTAWSECGGALIQREEKRLNDIWKRVFPTLSPSTQEALRTEQRAWVAFKDASCEYWTNREEYGREGQVLHFPSCRAAVIAERIRYLENVGKRQ